MLSECQLSAQILEFGLDWVFFQETSLQDWDILELDHAQGPKFDSRTAKAKTTKTLILVVGKEHMGNSD